MNERSHYQMQSASSSLIQQRFMLFVLRFNAFFQLVQPWSTRWKFPLI